MSPSEAIVEPRALEAMTKMGEVFAGCVAAVHTMGIVNTTRALSPRADIDSLVAQTVQLLWQASDALEEVRQIVRAS